ncbi:endopeptidase La [Anaeromicropila populeti]|uniref:Lon protease n=1 Tax=Anaeromicropila populeti TaxID=37658 RepID=A0A1I6K0J3_9FIRM|nr:endopeptidase La [Anaeromicropila populeti]SFR84721.1 ATP-dependent Lon protease [Anaeromicropila populeti]
MENFKRNIPVVALRNLTVLPGMMIHLDINRDITIKAVEAAMLGDQMVFAVTQKDEDIELPKKDELEEMGTISLVKQVIRLSDGVLRVMVVGVERAQLLEYIEDVEYINGQVQCLQDDSLDVLSELEKKAMMAHLKELFQLYCIETNKSETKILKKITEIQNLTKLVDEVAINILMDYKDQHKIMNLIYAADRFEFICILITEEIELFKYRKEIQSKVKEKVDKNQKEYLLREQLKVIREELGETNTLSEAEEYLERAKKLKASDEVKDKIKQEINRFKSIASSSAESAVSRGYIETLLDLPWDKSKRDSNDLKNAKKIMNSEHYGLTKVKDRILDFLAVRSLTGKGDSPIICLVGPPGTGKTSIAKSVANALNKEYTRISLGGVRDEAEIRGHRKTYVGAMPGRIVTALKSAGVKNPLMLLDEIDKVSSDYKGDTSSALLEVLDGEQNSKFVDHYVEVPVDLSEVLFFATANSVETIPKPLLDRMEVIQVSSYTENEKLHIAKEHLVPKQIKRNGLSRKQMSISSKALEQIILGYTKEAGVRNLERRIGEICRKAAREIIEEDKKQIRINENNLNKYLGNVKYTVDFANEVDEVGIARGLAWTSVGGDTLQIEVNIMPGKGKMELTGQLGDVMKESAKAGISYIRSVSDRFSIQPEFFEKHDMHVHIPEGAVPKDGPSAGITMATAMLSAITNAKVKADVAMTGEITLRGRVLPIGGLKEKILAAKAAKINTVLVPAKNKKDVEELEEEILENIQIKYVETMDQVISSVMIQ